MAVKPSRYAADKARDESAAIRAKLNNDIKSGTPEQIYLLYGEEAFLRRSYKNRLKELITGGDEMNYAYFEGTGIDVPAVIDLAQTLPFFAERRLIIVENSGWFSGKDASALVKVLEELPETTYLIFCEESIDKRMVFTKKVLELGSHDMFVARIVGVQVEDSLLDKKGRLDLTKADLIVYSHGEYAPLKESIGKFGFSVKKK